MSDDLFDSGQSAISPFKFGAVASVTSSGVMVKWVEDAEASTKEYKVAESYYPQVGDSIIAARIQNSDSSSNYVILCAYGAPKSQPDYIPMSQKAAANGVATLNSSGQVVQKAVSAGAADSASHASSADTATSATNATTAQKAVRMASSGGSVSTLSTAATLQQAIEKINDIIEACQEVNVIGY